MPAERTRSERRVRSFLRFDKIRHARSELHTEAKLAALHSKVPVISNHSATTKRMIGDYDMNKSFDTELAQIGKRIYRRRVELGVSGTELAASASISVSTLSNVENGQRNISVKSFCAIAKALEVPLSRLQPVALDTFSENHPDMRELQAKLEALPPERRFLMLRMFNAQLDTVLSIETEKVYHP